MFAKLRIQFVALTMLLVALVFVVCITLILFSYYRSDLHHVEVELDNAIERVLMVTRSAEKTYSDPSKSPQTPQQQDSQDQQNPQNQQDQQNPQNQQNQYNSQNIQQQTQPSAQVQNQQQTQTQDQQKDLDQLYGQEPYNYSGNPRLGGPEKDENDIVVASYILLQNGRMIGGIDSKSLGIISKDVLFYIGPEILKKQEDTGFLLDEGLIYKKVKEETFYVVAFADISTVSGWESLAPTLVQVGIFVLLGTLIISIFFSKWALKPVKNAWEQQKQFIADASHDLKTPITVILANTSILQGHPEKTVDSQMHWVDSTQHESEKMLSLINHMLDMARIDNLLKAKKEAQKEFKIVPLSLIAEGVVLEMEGVAFDSDIQLNSQVEPYIYIKANQSHVIKMANTILENAFKHAGENETITVTLKRNKKKTHAIFSIHNEKSVIPKEDLPHIFERFYRSDKARTYNADDSKQQSHGLGLAIAKGIAEESGGTLSAESSPETGTTFIAKFPTVKYKSS